MSAPVRTRTLVAPPPPRRRRSPAVIGIVLVSGLFAAVVGLGGMLLTAVVPVAVEGRCDPALLAPPPTTGFAGLAADQIATARAVLDTGRRLAVPPRGLVVALAVGMQESSLRNLDHGDRDSLGVFQQRPSQGWGTPAQVRDVAHASEEFFRRLVGVRGWADMPVTQAAQAVQRSGLPGAYARWEGLAATLVAGLAQVADVSGCIARPPDPAPGGTTATAVIAWASKQLGDPYRWGATGPNAFDCSGLVLRAFGAAGVTLPRTSRDQFRAGRQVPRAQAQPGDLLFWATNRANPATIHHVAIYLGGNRILEAPYTGQNVRIRALRATETELLGVAVRPSA